MSNRITSAGTDAQKSDAAEVPTSSQPCSNTFVSGSLQFAEGFVEGEGYCDTACNAVVWENDLCIYRNECPIGCGTVWVFPSNDR